MRLVEQAEYNKVLRVPAGKRISRRFLRRNTTGLERKSVRTGRKLTFWENYLERNPGVIIQAEADREKLRPKQLTDHEESDTVVESVQETAD